MLEPRGYNTRLVPQGEWPFLSPTEGDWKPGLNEQIERPEANDTCLSLFVPSCSNLAPTRSAPLTGVARACADKEMDHTGISSPAKTTVNQSTLPY